LPDWPYGSLNLILFAEAAAAFEELTLSGAVSQLKAQVPDAWPNIFRQSRFLSAVDFVQADRLRRSVPVADADETLNELHLRLANRKEPLTAMVAAAFDEIRRSGDAPRAGIKERVASHLRRIEIAFGRRLTRSTGLLATIGSTAPFIGLFGTVWGIMDSFIGISQAQTTNLAVVAPGIAEALLATAAGLVAAIPAVVIYNGFARSIGGYRAMLADLAAAVERLVSRELDSGRRSSKAAAE